MTNTFSIDALVHTDAVLFGGRATGYPEGHAHILARRCDAVGTVRSTEERQGRLVYFVQHEECGAFAAYLAHELRPTTAPPRPPRLEEWNDHRNIFINLRLPGESGRFSGCMLCAAVRYPDGPPSYGRTDDAAAEDGHELCGACRTLVRAVVTKLASDDEAITTAMLHTQLVDIEPTRLCLATEYLGDRGILKSAKWPSSLPPPGERATFRMGRAWSLARGPRPGWNGEWCRSEWTWGPTWLRLRCATCDVCLRNSRGCNVAGFNYATAGAWAAWADHVLLGLKPRRHHGPVQAPAR